MLAWAGNFFLRALEMFKPLIFDFLLGQLNKLWGVFERWLERRRREKEDAIQLAKHEQTVNKPEVTDEELGQSFEDIINGPSSESVSVLQQDAGVSQHRADRSKTDSK